MKKKTLLMILLVASAALLPLLAIRAQGDVDAGPDQTVYEGQQVAFNGSTTANQSAIVSVVWDFGDESEAVNGSDPALLNETVHTYTTAGEYNVTLYVTYDSELDTTENDTLTVTVLENLPPVADAGPDQIVEQTSPAGAEVVLNASGSSDPYDDPLTYDWAWTGGFATGVSPTVTLPSGTTIVTLTVSDGINTDTDTVNITVVDTTPPEIMASVTPDSLWPPNHKYVQVEATVTAQDAGDPSPTITFVSITSNEPDNGKGDGNTVNDIIILDDYTFEFRAERSGNSVGRVYTITYQATDASGNSAQASATVTVNHNP